MKISGYTVLIIVCQSFIYMCMCVCLCVCVLGFLLITLKENQCVFTLLARNYYIHFLTCRIAHTTALAISVIHLWLDRDIRLRGLTGNPIYKGLPSVSTAAFDMLVMGQWLEWKNPNQR